MHPLVAGPGQRTDPARTIPVDPGTRGAGPDRRALTSAAPAPAQPERRRRRCGGERVPFARSSTSIQNNGRRGAGGHRRGSSFARRRSAARTSEHESRISGGLAAEERRQPLLRERPSIAVTSVARRPRAGTPCSAGARAPDLAASRSPRGPPPTRTTVEAAEVSPAEVPLPPDVTESPREAPRHSVAITRALRRWLGGGARPCPAIYGTWSRGRATTARAVLTLSPPPAPPGPSVSR